MVSLLELLGRLEFKSSDFGFTRILLKDCGESNNPATNCETVVLGKVLVVVVVVDGVVSIQVLFLAGVSVVSRVENVVAAVVCCFVDIVGNGVVVVVVVVVDGVDVEEVLQGVVVVVVAVVTARATALAVVLATRPKDDTVVLTALIAVGGFTVVE